MNAGPAVAGAAVVLAVAVRVLRRRRAAGRAADRPSPAAGGGAAGWTGPWSRRGRRGPRRAGGTVGLVAAREVRERTRSRVFVIGTAVVLLVVAAAIVVPVLNRGHRGMDRVGIVGSLSAPVEASIVALGPGAGTTVTVVREPTAAAAASAVRSGDLTLAVVDGTRILVRKPFAVGDTSGAALLTAEVARVVALQQGLEQAGLSPAAAARLAHPVPLPVQALEPSAAKSTARTVGLYGVILTFVLLSQYGTWVLMGVVEEKANRVVEVLLATMRPGQLLSGKVLGIGLVGFGQAALLVGFALVLAEGVGSPLLQGAAVASVAVALVWVVLAYFLYCWVFAAAGSLAQRQEHVQSLAFPLQLPILVGYLVGLTAIASGDASTFVRVLAYLPPTAPFCMPVLVALGVASWWEVVLAALLTVAATAGVARVATRVYTRAILRTGQRVRLRSVLGAAAR